MPRIVLHKFDSLFHKCINIVQRNMQRELLKTQQQTIASFVESIEKEISTNSELVQSLLEQASSAASKSLQEQVDGLIAKERENPPSSEHWRRFKMK